STSSDTPSRASDPSDPRPASSAAPPPKAKPPRHKRLSHLFHRATTATAAAAPGHHHSRWASEKKLAELRDPPPTRWGLGLLQPPVHPQDLRRGPSPAAPTYKSVLATPRCSARQLVREALERYGLNPEDFGQFRALRRGLPPPTRRLHRNRSRAASGGPAPPARDPRDPRDPGPAMRRSISDMNLSTRRRQRKALSLAGGGDTAATPPAGPPPAPGTPPDSGTPPGDGGPSLELLSQCLIQPPRDRPYFLLLQGYGKEDFVLYIMTRPQHIFGRPERRGGVPEPKPGGLSPDTPPATPETPDAAPQKPDPGPFSVVDTFLDAPDILPRHCLVQAAPGPGAGGDPGLCGDPPPATVRPFRGAAASLNGTPLLRRAPLHPGDLLGLGEHVLLLYKDPRLGEGARPAWVPPPRASLGILGGAGVRGVREEPPRAAGRAAGGSGEPRAELRYRPQDEPALLRDILAMQPGGSEEGPPDGDPPPRAGPGRVTSDLRPLLLWLANAVELLNLAQGHLQALEGELDIEGPCPELERDLGEL
ncbi:unnamed protein product, partial [Coccothraustes coccothraustes]